MKKKARLLPVKVGRRARWRRRMPSSWMRSYALLQEQSVRDLTMETVAKRAGVGKPTLYKMVADQSHLGIGDAC